MFIKFRISIGFIVVFLCVPASAAQQPDTNGEGNIRFERLKSAIFAQPYDRLPNYKVGRKAFGKSGKSEKNQLLKAARRTLQDERDLIELPSGHKLLNANGICFVAQWVISESSGFTGLFAKGVTSPVIMRASVALSGTRQKDKRAFGMAIKLLPANLADEPSINFFVLNSMGGAVTKHVLGLSMDNQPPLGRIPRWRDIPTALRLRKDLQQADLEQGAENPQVAFRPVTQLASYRTGVESSVDEQAVAPKWLRLSALTAERIDKDDFRDELRLENYVNKQLVYQIEVAADNGGEKSKADWTPIGTLSLLESVTSPVCDNNLHFKHPRLSTNTK